MKNQRILIIVLTLVLLLIVAVGLSQAQGPGPDSAAESQESLGPATAVSDEIPIQGRLTDASGSPISGTRTITFTLYDSSVGGTTVCQDVDAVVWSTACSQPAWATARHRTSTVSNSTWASR